LAVFFIASDCRASAETVYFKTSDGVRIAAEYTAPAATGAPVFVLLHGLGAGRGEWRVFRATLAARGYGTLALDARGHGESGGGSYRTFTTSGAWTAIEKDLDAAADFLAHRGVAENRLVLAGASIGANIVLRGIAARSAVPFVILLSPGTSYQGIFIEPLVRKLKRPLIAAAARDDPYSYRALFLMHDWVRHTDSALLSAGSGHGTGMLEGKINRKFYGELMRRIDRLVRISFSSAAPAEKQASP